MLHVKIWITAGLILGDTVHRAEQRIHLNSENAALSVSLSEEQCKNITVLQTMTTALQERLGRKEGRGSDKLPLLTMPRHNSTA